MQFLDKGWIAESTRSPIGLCLIFGPIAWNAFKLHHASLSYQNGGSLTEISNRKPPATNRPCPPVQRVWLAVLWDPRMARGRPLEADIVIQVRVVRIQCGIRSDGFFCVPPPSPFDISKNVSSSPKFSIFYIYPIVTQCFIAFVTPYFYGKWKDKGVSTLHSIQIFL